MSTDPIKLGIAESAAAALQAGNLDVLLGEVLTPDKVDQPELTVRPHSLQRLDTNTARWLKSFMQATEDGLGVTKFVYCALPILWVADKSGQIWFAVEEIITADTNEFIWPRLLRFDVPENHYRLGHPALLVGERTRAGRIGGEILFDVRAEPPVWVITNGSGRYGTRPGRIEAHLTGAMQKFQEYGIILKPCFLEPRQ